MAAARNGEARADEMLRNADVAMYIAKGDGKDSKTVGTSGLTLTREPRAEFVAELLLIRC